MRRVLARARAPRVHGAAAPRTPRGPSRPPDPPLQSSAMAGEGSRIVFVLGRCSCIGVREGGGGLDGASAKLGSRPRTHQAVTAAAAAAPPAAVPASPPVPAPGAPPPPVPASPPVPARSDVQDRRRRRGRPRAELLRAERSSSTDESQAHTVCCCSTVLVVDSTVRLGCLFNAAPCSPRFFGDSVQER